MSLKIRVLACGIALAMTPTLSALAEVPISEDARAHFSAGVNLLQDPDGARYEEAYREFKEAYAESPSWKILGNLGISAMKLERDSEAIDAIKKYLAEGGRQIDKDERAQFQRDLATLEAGVARVTLQTEPTGAVIEDERLPSSGQPIRNAYVATGPLAIGVRSGRHRFTAKLKGRVEQVWEVELSPKQQESHGFVLPEPSAAAPVATSPAPAAPAASVDTTPAPRPGSGLRTGAYVAFGVGVVGLAAGTIFGLQAKSKYADANKISDESCPPTGPCNLPATLYDERSQLGKDGDTAKTLSLVGFIVGGVGVAGGVTLFVLSSKKEQPAAARVEPYLGLGQLGVRGTY